MKLLLDTHTLLWWLADEPRLADPARSAIARPDNDVYVSAASAWELAIKAGLGKVSLPDDLGAQLVANSFTPLPVQLAHGLAVRHLPEHHRDPFDRVLVAQAQIEGLTVVTADQWIPRYDVAVLPAETPLPRPAP
ncbi:MAG: type II toxin-antitoxin system VapC family toxin [Mycobacteriales bacterium]